MTRPRPLIDLGMGVYCLLVGIAAFPAGLFILWYVALGTARPPWLFLLYAGAAWAVGVVLVKAGQVLLRSRA